MVSQQRQKYLLNTAQKEGFVSIPKTAELFDVSIETIRRDVNLLCQQNLLKKVFGGAVPTKASIWREPDSSKGTRIQHSKIAIAREAAKMIRDGDAVSFDGCSTTLELANCLRDIRRVTFVVNSMPIATLLYNKTLAGEISGTIITTGGQINTNAYRSLTYMALETIDKYHYDIVFVTATAVSADSVSNSSTNPGIYSQHLMRRATKSVLLAESNRLGKTSICDFAKPTDFDYIITDDENPCPTDLLEGLRDSGTELIVVSCKPEGR